MSLFSKAQQQFGETIEQLAFGNPFLPERILLERKALGREFEEGDPPVWSLRMDVQKDRPNVMKINAKVAHLAEAARSKLVDQCQYTERELYLYETLILYLVYYRCYDFWWGDATDNGTNPGECKKVWEVFNEQFQYFFRDTKTRSEVAKNAAFWFALLNQICRAFKNIFRSVVGQSSPAVKLRSDTWQSIFTYDLRRYQRGLFENMGDITTLVSGPSGTGKELVATAIGASRFIPFDESRYEFSVKPNESFHALNLSALSPTLIESELFGHAQAAYTGASRARAGWFEQCSTYGTVFLDEIGELDGGIQVKLLRVLQTRAFHRMGEHKTRRFTGKVISATNRNLFKEIKAGRFREDLYYRLCSDLIVTPSLQELLGDSEEDLFHLARFISRRVAGELADEICEEVLSWIQSNLPKNYHWPGNTRELEQCVRNIMIHGEYLPQRTEPERTTSFWGQLRQELGNHSISADQLTQRYCTYVYWKTQNYQRTGEILGLDRRTVKAKLDDHLLNRLEEEAK